MTSNMGTVLIGGGTGFIGSAVTALLRKKGYSIVIVSRMPGPQRMSWSDIHKVGIPEDCKAVVNVAGQNILDPKYRWTAGFKQNVWASRVNTTKSLATAINESGSKPEVFVSISGVGYYPPSETAEYTEDSPGGDFDFLSKLCTEWEDAAKLNESSKTVRQVVIRSGVVLGRQGGMVQQLYWPFYLGAGGPVGSGKQFLPWIHINDMARLFHYAVENKNVRGVVNGVAPKACTNGEFSKALARAMWRPCLFPVPEFVLNIAFGEERAKVMTKGQNVKPKKLLELGFNYDYPDVDSACKEVAKMIYVDDPNAH